MASRTVEIVIAARDQFTGTANKVIGSLNRMDSASRRVGRGVGQMGAGIARASTLIAGAAVTGLGAAAKAAIDFEDAFAGVRKTVDEAELAAAGLTFEDIALSFRKMATEIPIAATEFARIGETAGALGIKAQDIDEFTKTVALLGVTTDLTTDAAAESLGKIGTILNFTGQDFENFADILVNLGNKGASTESEIIEITKRFAAAGRQAGLSVPQIAAFASAIASAGVEPEAAGSSLSRLFGNLITETARATDKGKAFAEVVGMSFKDFSKTVETDTIGAMLKFLDTLKDLSAFDQQRALKAVGITNVRDRNAILLLAGSYEKNLLPALQNAGKAEGALSAEAQKRFDTLKSQLLLFRNNLVEAGITIGEGMLPALKKATEALTKFLQLPSTKTDLKNLGEDIGRAIDSINWGEVLSGAKTFLSILKDTLSFAKGILDVVNLLPTQVKAAGLGFIALNKLSGGLLASGAGNIIAGAGGALIQGAGARLPGVAGKLFAQPVFVTNWPVGMGMGGAGALGVGKGGGLFGKLGTALGLLSIVGSITSVIGTQQQVSQESTDQAKSLTATLREMLAQNPNEQALRDALGGVEQGIKDLESNPLNVLVQGEALDELRLMRGLILDQLRTPGANQYGPPTPPGKGKTTSDPSGRNLMSVLSLDAIRQRALAKGFHPTDAAVQKTFERNQQRLIDLQNRIRDQEAKTTAAVLIVANELKSDDRKEPLVIPPPKVEVNVSVSASNVTHKTIQIRRYGPTGGSRHVSGPLVD